MKNKKQKILFVQQQLNARGFDAGPEDGILGLRTLAAIETLEGINSSWSAERKLVGCIQVLARERNIETGVLDGYWGPQTQHAFELLHHLLEQGNLPPVWRPEDITESNPNGWPHQTPESELVKFYGEVDTNQTSIDLPYQHRLSWNKVKAIKRFSIHERVHDSVLRVLNRVLSHYGEEEIKRLRLDLWGGCLNVRKMRGGNSYSMHSWGIALDYDPEHNQLKWGRDRAAFARQEYERWWQLWEEEGWVSLGRMRNFDWMHVQAAKI